MTGLIYLRYSDLFDEKPHLQTLKKHLRRFKRSDILHHLSRINTFLSNDRMMSGKASETQALHGALMRNYIDRDIYLNRILPRYGNEKLNEVFIFNRLGVLYLFRLAVLVCSEDAELLADGGTEGGHLLGRCFLMVNDHLVGKKQERDTGSGSDEKIIKHLALQISPLLELYNPVDVLYGIYRFNRILFEILPSAEFKSFLDEENVRDFDLTKKFKDLTGISLKSYRDLMLGVYSFLLSNGKENPGSFPMFNRSGFISQGKIPQRVFDIFLKIDGVGVERLKNSLTVSEKTKIKVLNPFSFMPMKTKPFVEYIPNHFVPSDSGFIVEKFGLGSYWTIFDSLGKKDRETFSQFYGYLFEFYVNSLLKEITSKDSQKQGIFIDNVKYENGEKFFDALIYFPKTKHLIVLEHKASLLTVEAKYSGSIRKFEKDLKLKYVVNQKGSPKGVRQIAFHLQRLFSRNPDQRQKIDNDYFNSILPEVEKVSPVLIALEPFFKSHLIEGFFLNSYFDRELENIRLTSRVKLNPLAVLEIETLENLKRYLEAGDATLEQCLNLRSIRDPNYKSPFDIGFLFDFGLLRRPRPHDEAMAYFFKAMDRAGRKWFRKEYREFQDS